MDKFFERYKRSNFAQEEVRSLKSTVPIEKWYLWLRVFLEMAGTPT